MRTPSILLCLLATACVPPAADSNEGELAADDLEQFTPGATFQRFLELNGGKLSFSDDLFEGITRRARRKLVPDTNGDDTGATYGAMTIPHGRSLERRHTDHTEPRVCAVLPLDGVRRGLRDRMFMCYTPRLQQLEIISPNENGTGNGGYTDFAVVRDFRPGGSPDVVFPRGGVCTACHKGGQPLWAEPWIEQVNGDWFSGYDDNATIREDSPLSPSLRDLFLKLRPNISNYAFAAEARFESRRMYGSELIGMLDARYVDRDQPQQINEGDDPLLDPQGLPLGMMPKLREEHVAKAQEYGEWRDTCRDWRDVEQPDTSEANIQHIYGEFCAGCHASSYGAQFDIPLFSLEAATRKDFAVGRANPSRTALHLVETCNMPPSRSRALLPKQRAALVAYLRGKLAATP